VLQGGVKTGDLSPAIWHGHEMLFGFAVAVIATVFAGKKMPVHAARDVYLERAS